jgi:hypothetical protein
VPKAAIALGDEAVTPFLLAESKPDGTFEFPAVVDGEWRLSAEVESGGVKLRLAHWIEMTGHELDGVVLPLNAPFMVRGRVVIDTPKGWVAPKPPSMSLLPVRRGRLSVWSLLEPAQLARSDADGDFSLSPVYPGI